VLVDVGDKLNGDLPDNTLGLPNGSVSYLRGEELGYIILEPKAIGWCAPSPSNGLKFELAEPRAIGSGGPRSPTV